MFNTKENELAKINHYSLPQRLNFMEEKLFCMYGGITGIIHFEFFNSMQTYSLNSCYVCMKI